MDFSKELIIEVLKSEKIEISFPDLKFNAIEVIEMTFFKALQEIKTIIENDSLSDFECIEKIVCIFEKIGSGGGNKHDFN